MTQLSLSPNFTIEENGYTKKSQTDAETLEEKISRDSEGPIHHRISTVPQTLILLRMSLHLLFETLTDFRTV